MVSTNRDADAKVAPCPDPWTLEMLLIGKLPRGQAVELEQHVLACDQCAQFAESAGMRDDLVDLLGSVGSNPSSERLLQIIESGKRLRKDVDTVLDQDTVTGHNASKETEDLRFLAAPQISGELGRLGQYRILELIGAGGMGLVFRAEDSVLLREVALKVMRPHQAIRQVDRLRFLREARAAAAIDHGHVVTVHDVGEVDSIPFIAMPLLRGETLGKRLAREGRLEEAQVLQIGIQISAGLAAAHQAGLIHRDIKPDNIWLETSGDSVKILDFGLVRPLEANADLTHREAILGTPRFMAPEQAAKSPADHRCDLFSLGSVLYRALTGKFPFSGTTAIECMSAVMTEKQVPARKVDSTVSKEFSHCLQHLLAKDPDHRIQTANELQAELQRISDLNKHRSSRHIPKALAISSLMLFAGIVLTIKFKNGSETKVTLSSSKGTAAEVEFDLSDSPAVESIEVTHSEDPEPAPASESTPPEASKPEATPDAAAAKWLLQMGIPFTVKYPSGSVIPDKPIHQKNALPENARIATISFEQHRYIDDSSIERLKDLRSLTSLNLAATKVTSRGLETISNLSSLESLMLVELKQFTAEDAKQIAKLPRLRYLSLYWTSIDDACLRELTRISSLQVLVFSGWNVSEDALEHVGELKDLRRLDINPAPACSTRNLRSFSQLEKLESLRLYDCDKITGESLPALARFHSLTELLLNDTGITDQGMVQFPLLPELDTLGFASAPDLSETAIEALASQPRLRRLIVTDGTNATFFSGLKKLPKLESLTLNRIELTPEIIDALCTLTQLQSFSCAGCKVTPTIATRLKKSLPGCVFMIPPAEDASP